MLVSCYSLPYHNHERIRAIHDPSFSEFVYKSQKSDTEDTASVEYCCRSPQTVARLSLFGRLLFDNAWGDADWI